MTSLAAATCAEWKQRLPPVIAMLAAALTILGASVDSGAQARRTRIPKVVYLSSGFTTPSSSPFVPALRQGLRDLGYIDSQNISVEFRYIGGNPPLDVRAELARSAPDVILAGGPQATLAARNATTTTPIVFVGQTDPVATGLVASLARPGGNLTGFTVGPEQLGGKQLELLKEVVPRLARVAVLSLERDDRAASIVVEVEKAALAFGVGLQRVEVQRADDFAGAFQAASTGRASALQIVESPLFTANSARLAALAMKHRLPAIALLGVHAESGLLMTYGPDLAAVFHRAATYIDKILKGAKPGELPVEQPSKFELVVNLKTAKALGLTIPQSVLIRADRIIR